MIWAQKRRNSYAYSNEFIELKSFIMHSTQIDVPLNENNAPNWIKIANFSNFSVCAFVCVRGCSWLNQLANWIMCLTTESWLVEQIIDSIEY